MHRYLTTTDSPGTSEAGGGVRTLAGPLSRGGGCQQSPLTALLPNSAPTPFQSFSRAARPTLAPQTGRSPPPPAPLATKYLILLDYYNILLLPVLLPFLLPLAPATAEWRCTIPAAAAEAANRYYLTPPPLTFPATQPGRGGYVYLVVMPRPPAKFHGHAPVSIPSTTFAGQWRLLLLLLPQPLVPTTATCLLESIRTPSSPRRL